jgi:hypothetical protein
VSVRRAYCSAVDRNVPVILKPGTSPDRRTAQDPADLICLDYQVRCTGWCCPLYSVGEEPAPGLVAIAADAPGPAAGRSGPRTRSERRWNRPT